MILALLALIAAQRLAIRRLQYAVAAKSTVERKVDKRVEKREVRGIVVTKEITRTEPSGVIIVTKEIVEQPVTTLEVTRAVIQHRETPTCPAPRRPHRYFAGLVTNPGNIRGDVAPRLGINIAGRVDLAWSKTLHGGLLDGHRIDAAWRFGR